MSKHACVSVQDRASCPGCVGAIEYVFPRVAQAAKLFPHS